MVSFCHTWLSQPYATRESMFRPMIIVCVVGLLFFHFCSTRVNKARRTETNRTNDILLIKTRIFLCTFAFHKLLIHASFTVYDIVCGSLHITIWKMLLVYWLNLMQEFLCYTFFFYRICVLEVGNFMVLQAAWNVQCCSLEDKWNLSSVEVRAAVQVTKYTAHFFFVVYSRLRNKLEFFQYY